jgi:hypothetical protein
MDWAWPGAAAAASRGRASSPEQNASMERLRLVETRLPVAPV